MIDQRRAVDALTVGDLESHAVWSFSDIDQLGETMVQPVGRLPAENLVGRLVAVQALLANGTRFWALVGNIDVGNARLTQQFLTLALQNGGSWFALARYHDHDFAERGPEALSRFLGLEIDDIFPISIDLRPYVLGNSDSLLIAVPRAPAEKLSRAEIIAMAVP